MARPLPGYRLEAGPRGPRASHVEARVRRSSERGMLGLVVFVEAKPGLGLLLVGSCG